MDSVRKEVRDKPGLGEVDGQQAREVRSRENILLWEALWPLLDEGSDKHPEF